MVWGEESKVRCWLCDWNLVNRQYQGNERNSFYTLMLFSFWVSSFPRVAM